MASLFSGSTPTRPLVIHSTATRISIPVPASPLSAWVTSEVLAQDFHDSRVGLDDDVPPPAEEVEEGAVPTPPSNESQIKLLARFLAFTASRYTSSPGTELAQVLLAAYDRFNELFLSAINIHSLVQSLDPETRAEILTAYFRAFTIAREALGGSKVKLAHTSALLEAAKAGDAELYALFGGQGVNEVSTLIVGGTKLTQVRHTLTSCNLCTTYTLPSSNPC
jgi:fatty acid synthase subunit beta